MDRPQGRLTALKAAALIATSTYVTTALGLLVSVVVARSLGPKDYGQYAYLLWLSGLLVVFGNHGLSITGIRFVSETLGRGEPDEARNVHQWLRRQQWLSILGVLVGFVGLIMVWHPAGWQASMSLLIGVLIVSVVAKAIFLFDISIAKGYSRFSVEAVTNMVMSLLYAVGVGILGLMHADLATFSIFFAIISAGHVVMVSRLLRKEGIAPGTGQCSPELLTRLKPHLAWTVVLVLVVTLSNKTIETLLLSALTGPEEVGFFAIATALTRGGVDLLSSTLTTMLMPMMAHAFGAGGMRKVNVILSDAVRYFLFVGLILAGLGTLWAALGVSVMYGHRYEPVVNVLRVMMLAGGLTLSESAFGAVLSTTDHQKLRAGVSILAVIVSAITACILVPLYGLAGAVAAHAISRVLVLLIMGTGLVRMLHVTFPVRELLRLMASALGAALLVLPLLWISSSPWMQFCGGLVYLVAFVTATMQLRAWQAKDGQLLLSLIQRKPQVFKRVTPWVERWAQSLPAE
jgi:O-antigen/teichoic acid export membrane protein